MCVQEVRTDRRRWAILALLSVIGTFIEIMTVLSGTVSEILETRFNLNSEEMDWIFLSNAIATVAFALPLGLLARLYPLEIKIWLISAYLLLLFSYIFSAISTLDKRVFFLIYLGQILCGIAFAIFVILLGLSSISWFTESEQATVFGVAYGCFSAGNLLGAMIPMTFLSTSLKSNVANIVYVMMRMYIGFSVFIAILIIVTCFWIPNLPPSPPSNLEFIRRTNAASESKPTLQVAAKQYGTELMGLMKDWSSQALLWTYSLSMTIALIFFLMMPILSNQSGIPNHLLSSAKKSYFLSCFAGGGAIAAMAFGILLDKVKSYRPLACGLAISNVVFALALVVAYFKHSEISLYLLLALQGATVMSILSFTSEILKQHIYPKVEEGTQAIVISALCEALFALFVYIYRSGSSWFGQISFYVITAICCFIQALLLLCINPQLNRFRAENQRLLSSP